MKHKQNVFLVILISFCVPVLLFARQQFLEEITTSGFVKRIDGLGKFMAAVQTTDGGFLSVSVSGAGFTKGLIATKFSSSGIMLWKTSFEVTPGGWPKQQNWQEIPGIAEVSDGYILGGSVSDWDRGTAGLLIKLDKQGSIIWSKSLCTPGSNVGCFIAVNSIAGQPGGTFIVSGDGNENAILMKFNAAGNRIWAKAFPQLKTVYHLAPNHVYPSGMVSSATSDHGFVLATMRLKGNEPDGVYLLKVNADGKPIWNRNIRMKGFTPRLIRVTSDDSIILFDFSTNIVMTLSPGGRFQWAAKYSIEDGLSGKFQLADAIQTADGGYAMVGNAPVYWGGELIDHYGVLLKIDRDGNPLFQKRLGKKLGDGARTIFSTSDDGYVIFGSRDAVDSQSQLLLRVDSKGKLSGCNYIATIDSIKRKLVPGIKTSKFNLKKPLNLSFASHTPDVASAKVKGSIEAICE